MWGKMEPSALLLVRFQGVIYLLMVASVAYSELSDYSVLLWLKSSENVDPYAVWTGTVSSYNSDTNTPLETLVSDGTSGHRDSRIDNWSQSTPAMVRVVYRNDQGHPLFHADFNTTGKSSTNWFSRDTIERDIYTEYTFHSSLFNHDVSFALANHTSSGALAYHATVLTTGGSIYYIFAGGSSALYLPPDDASSPQCCDLQTNPVDLTKAVTDITHAQCAAYCRKNSKSRTAAHNESCACRDSSGSATLISKCTVDCTGDVTTKCGGSETIDISGTLYYVDYFTGFSSEIDGSRLGTQTTNTTQVTITGSSQEQHPGPVIIHDYLLETTWIGTVKMVVSYHTELCASSVNRTFNVTKSVAITSPAATSVSLASPFRARCTNISLLDAATDDPLTTAVDVTAVTIRGDSFATAPIFSIEAAWDVESPTGLCPCACHIYNMLYGESPYANLTYDEKKEALKNVTDKIEKELTVNKTTLSSTIRKKTSAEDTRQSAVVVGYALGVSLLAVTFGLILLSDMPVILVNIRKMYDNLRGRYVDE